MESNKVEPSVHGRRRCRFVDVGREMIRPKWIFFDLGWTLVDETEAHRSRLIKTSLMLVRFGMACSVDQLIALCEVAATGFAPSPFHEMLTRLGLSASQVDAIKSSVHYAKEYERLYADVAERLAELSTQFRLGIIANQSKGTENRLAQWGIRKHFSLIFASAEFGLSKPDSRIFAAAVSRAGCQPGEAIMVGDRIDNDIGPARLAGWRTVRVLQGFHRFQVPRGQQESPNITIAKVGHFTADKALEATHDSGP